MTIRTALVSLGTVALLAAGCSASDSANLTACEAAMQQAAEVSDMEDVGTDTDPAMIASASVADFAAASDKFPAALDGVDVELYLGNRCLYSDAAAVTASPICTELA